MITGRCPNDGKDVSSGTEHEHYSKPGNSFCSGSETVFEKSPPGIYLRPVVSRPVQAHLPVFIREHVQPSACEDKSHITRYCIYADSPDRYRGWIYQQFRKFPASACRSIRQRKSSSDLDLYFYTSFLSKIKLSIEIFEYNISLLNDSPFLLKALPKAINKGIKCSSVG